jgi:hypothetical protein
MQLQGSDRFLGQGKVMQLIVLSEMEQQTAKIVAVARYNNARKHKRPNLRMGPQSDEATDLQGIAGEIAFCKAMNVYPDLTIAKDLPDVDAIVDGVKIDVKTTNYVRGRLLATMTKTESVVDVYCLVLGVFPVYYIAGYMAADNLFKQERLIDLGWGKGYGAKQDVLSPTIKEALAWNKDLG